MPPREGISIAQFLTVADIERSARYYEKVFGARILSLGDGNAPGYLQLANIWMILNVGGGPTPDKPTVTLSVPDPNHINSFMNFRVADIQACYELWKSRGAEFITEPIPKYGEIRCYIRDPDGYIIEVGQSTDLKYGLRSARKSILIPRADCRKIPDRHQVAISALPAMLNVSCRDNLRAANRCCSAMPAFRP